MVIEALTLTALGAILGYLIHEALDNRKDGAENFSEEFKGWNIVTWKGKTLPNHYFIKAFGHNKNVEVVLGANGYVEITYDEPKK